MVSWYLLVSSLPPWLAILSKRGLLTELLLSACSHNIEPKWFPYRTIELRMHSTTEGTFWKPLLSVCGYYVLHVKEIVPVQIYSDFYCNFPIFIQTNSKVLCLYLPISTKKLFLDFYFWMFNCILGCLLFFWLPLTFLFPFHAYFNHAV